MPEGKKGREIRAISPEIESLLKQLGQYLGITPEQKKETGVQNQMDVEEALRVIANNPDATQTLLKLLQIKSGKEEE